MQRNIAEENQSLVLLKKKKTAVIMFNVLNIKVTFNIFTSYYWIYFFMLLKLITSRDRSSEFKISTLSVG